VCTPGSSASGEFSQIRAEVENLQIALAAVEEEFPTQAWINSRIDRSQRLELHKLLKGCNGLLLGVTEQLQPHAKLGAASASKWEALKFLKFDLKGTRSRLTAHANSINLFLSTLNAGRLRRMELKLEEMLAEAREGQRDLSALLREEEHNSQLADHQWKILEDELVESGFGRSDIASHRYWFETRAHISSRAASEASDVSSNASLLTATGDIPARDNVLALRSGRLYRVRHDCTAQNDDSIRLPHGDNIECMSNFAADILSPQFVCGFKHIRTSKIVMLKVSDIDELATPFTEGLYRDPETASTNNKSSLWHSPLPGVSTLDGATLTSSMASIDCKGRKRSTTVGSLFNRSSIFNRTPNRVPSSQSPLMNVRPLSVELQHPQILRRERSRRLSTTDSIGSRASSQTRSIKTEATEYDSDGRLVKSKTVTTTFNVEIIPRRSSAPPEGNKFDRSVPQRRTQDSSSPATEENVSVNQEVSDLLKYGRRYSSASSSMPNEQPSAHSPRRQQQQQSTDSSSRRRYPPSSMRRSPSTPDSAIPQSSEDNTIVTQMSRIELINLYERRTAQLRCVMELLRNHEVIAADPLDYRVERKGSVFKEIDILNSEIVASMTRRPNTGAQKVAVSVTARTVTGPQKVAASVTTRPMTGTQKVTAFLARKKSKTSLGFSGQGLTAQDRDMSKGKNRP
jgi:hypothetical protein